MRVGEGGCYGISHLSEHSVIDTDGASGVSPVITALAFSYTMAT